MYNKKNCKTYAIRSRKTNAWITGTDFSKSPVVQRMDLNANPPLLICDFMLDLELARRGIDEKEFEVLEVSLLPIHKVHDTTG